MKIIFRSAVMAALLIATACGKDDGPSVSEEMEQQAEEIEKTALAADTVSDNVVIKGSSKEAGTPPTPNGAISLDVSGTGKTAFLNEGFEVSLSSDAEIVGAYIQFKANDGTVSGDFYDVNLTSNAQSGSSAKIGNSVGFTSKKGTSLSAKNDTSATLDVDFNTNIEPGTFCYVVCVYDGNGNISEPSEVCATVESWGGSAALTGEWNQVRSEEKYDDQVDVLVIGEEDCYSSTLTCENQETLTYELCDLPLSGTLVFNSNGTYTFVYEEEEVNIDYDASRSSCSAILEEKNLEVYKSSGNWAFNSEESRLTLVEYKWSETDNGVISEEETYAAGDAYLLFDGKINLSGNTFDIYEEYGSEGDLETYKTFFEK